MKFASLISKFTTPESELHKHFCSGFHENKKQLTGFMRKVCQFYAGRI